MYRPITDCRMCSSALLEPVLDLGQQALTGLFPKTRCESVPAGPLALLKCNQCGLVQLAHNYDLSMLYGETYGYRSGLNQSMVRHLASKVRHIESLVPLAAGDLVLDIGSNDGTTLGSYTTPGLRRVGMDPSGAKFKQYYQQGVDLIPDFFAAEPLLRYSGGQRAKVVTSIAMFYDLERPIEFVKQIIEVLDDEGIWVFEQSYLPTMIATNSYDTVCHEHLEYYSLKQIIYFTRLLGLKVVEIDFNDVNGGSFSVAVAKQQSSFSAAEEKVSRVLREEQEAGFDTRAPFEALHKAMVQHREDLLALLLHVKSEGKTVAGYGASTKGNVLLQYCGITPELLPEIAEVNPDKFGSFTPGTCIPIVSEAESRKAKPDYFLVLPWHFREGILAKETAYLEAGGNFIFPLPQLTVVSQKDTERVATPA